MSFGAIIDPVLPVTAGSKPRSGLALMLGPDGVPVYSRVKWMGIGKVAPPFFLAQMNNGPTEIAMLCGRFMEIIQVRFRHHHWVSAAQHCERLKVVVREKLVWNRLMDDYFVN